MSLEECKRIADERFRARLTRPEKVYSERRAKGWVDGGEVETALYPDDGNWIVGVVSHKHLAKSVRKFPRKGPAERYFEKLTRDYGLTEEEK